MSESDAEFLGGLHVRCRRAGSSDPMSASSGPGHELVQLDMDESGNPIYGYATDLDKCHVCGQRVKDFERGSYEDEHTGQRGHYACDEAAEVAAHLNAVNHQRAIERAANRTNGASDAD